MAYAKLDHARLLAALEQAQRAVGLAEPNPRVGCVIGWPDGRIAGQGHTQAVGGPHAEIMALRDAHARGESVAGACAWVTLEPCAHHGRTPPCADALVAAGIRRVVVGAHDPYPAVNGAGVERLRAAGLEVVPAPDAVRARCRELNAGFFSRHERQRPWVRLKVAVTLDGRTALDDGRSQWITGTAARADGHAWRRRADAVLTGIGTLLADDARMDVRAVPTTRQPLRVVLDSRHRLPPEAAWLRAPGDKAVLSVEPPRPDRVQPGVTHATLPADTTHGGLDLGAVLAWLHGRQVQELHVEAGPRLNGAWLASGLVDELLVYQGGLVMGPGRPLAALGVPAGLADLPRWTLHEAVAQGDDLRTRWLAPGVSTWLTAP